jgi:hypothetical protein
MQFGWVVLVVVGVVAAVTAFFAVANHMTRRAHAAFGAKDVISALKCVLDEGDSVWHDEFDLFLAHPIADPSLESIRKQCLEILRTTKPEVPGDDITEEGRVRFRAILHELEGRL